MLIMMLSLELKHGQSSQCRSALKDGKTRRIKTLKKFLFESNQRRKTHKREFQKKSKFLISMLAKKRLKKRVPNRKEAVDHLKKKRRRKRMKMTSTETYSLT